VQPANKDVKGRDRLRDRVDTLLASVILVLFLFTLAWGPVALGGRRPGCFLVIQGATIAMLGVWVARIWVQRRFRLLWPPMCWPVLGFLLYAIFRCRAVEVEYAGRQQLVQALVYGAIFFLAVNNLNRRHSSTAVSLTLIALGTLLSLFAVFQLATHYQKVWGVSRMDQYVERGSGTFLNPNHLAGFLGLTLPLALGFTVMSRFSATIKVVLGYCAVVMLAGLVVSVSRGGIMASVIALLTFCIVLLSQRDFWKSAVIILCVLTALGVLAVSQFDSLQKRFDKMVQHDKVGDERPLYWDAAWQLFDHHQLWGIGPGHFDVEFPSVRPWEVQARPTFTHNDYLNTLCDWGCAGLGIILVACGTLYWGAFQVWWNLRRPAHEIGSSFSDRTAFVVGAAIGLMALMLHCFVEFNMQIPGLAVAAITIMALLAAQWRFATERFWANPGWIGKIILTAILAAIMVYLSIQGLRKGTETYWQARADAEAASPERCLASATKAAEAEPMDWEADRLLADYLWKLSANDEPDSLERLKQALTWYTKAKQLNPFDAYAPLGCGMCLDRLDKTEEATEYFEVALRNDPHNCYVNLEIGRHCVELGELDAAKLWMEQGAERRAATEEADAETEKLRRNMADPLFVAEAANRRASKAQKLERNKTDPILLGPK